MGKPKNIPISEALHMQLKAISQRKGMKLSAMVEIKLRELVEREQQPELLATA